MKRALSIVVILGVASLVGACAFGPPAEIPPTLAPALSAVIHVEPPAGQPGAVPSVAGYDYIVGDAGDGWYTGTLHLWIENPGAEPAPAGTPLRNWGGYKVKDAYVETEEGKSYPVTITADYEFGYTEGVIDLTSMPAIPPGFRLKEGQSDIQRNEARDYTWGRYVVDFKFAQAAHPTFIRFPSQPEWSVDLAQASNPEPATPTDLADTDFESINALEGRVLLEEPDKLLVTLGRCVYIPTEGVDVAYLTYTANNLNQLDGTSIVVPVPPRAVVVQYKGLRYSDAIKTIDLGPGQVKEDGIPLFNASDEATHVILYWPDGTYGVYSTAGCGG